MGDNNIYILDSAALGKLTDSAKIQLGKLYCKPQEKYILVYCKVQPQNKGDCGVHAIANIVEYCLNSFSGQTDVQFKKEGLRKHLHDCLENNFFEPFPKKRTLKSKTHISARKTENFHMDCDCGYPDCFETMVQCDNKMCKKWYHIKYSGYCTSVSKILCHCFIVIFYIIL